MIVALAFKAPVPPSKPQYLWQRRSNGTTTLALYTTNVLGQLALNVLTLHSGLGAPWTSTVLEADAWHDAIVLTDATHRYVWIDAVLRARTALGPWDADNDGLQEWLGTDSIQQLHYAGELALPFFERDTNWTAGEAQALAYGRILYQGI